MINKMTGDEIDDIHLDTHTHAHTYTTVLTDIVPYRCLKRLTRLGTTLISVLYSFFTPFLT